MGKTSLTREKSVGTLNVWEKSSRCVNTIYCGFSPRNLNKRQYKHEEMVQCVSTVTP